MSLILRLGSCTLYLSKSMRPVTYQAGSMSTACRQWITEVRRGGESHGAARHAVLGSPAILAGRMVIETGRGAVLMKDGQER